MLDYFVPEDNETNDSAVHNQIRELIKEPIDTEDDKTFSREEIVSVIKTFNHKKAPGENGLTSEIILHVFRSFPSFLTDVYNKCLKEGCFTKQWKKSSIVPIIKPGKEENRDASKYRPINLLNVADKVLDKLMIDRILHHVHTSVGLNSNQYGFIPQRGTLDAAMAVKVIIEENLKQKNCTSVVSLTSEEHSMQPDGQALCLI